MTTPRRKYGEHHRAIKSDLAKLYAKGLHKAVSNFIKHPTGDYFGDIKFYMAAYQAAAQGYTDPQEIIHFVRECWTTDAKFDPPRQRIKTISENN